MTEEQNATVRILAKLHEIDESFQSILENLTAQIHEAQQELARLQKETNERFERLEGDQRAAGHFIN